MPYTQPRRPAKSPPPKKKPLKLLHRVPLDESYRRCQRSSLPRSWWRKLTLKQHKTALILCRVYHCSWNWVLHFFQPGYRCCASAVPKSRAGAAVVIAETNNKIGNTLGTALLEPLPTVVSQYSYSANETGVAKVIKKYDTFYSHRIKYPHSL